jgi:hypothetical protein
MRNKPPADAGISRQAAMRANVAWSVGKYPLSRWLCATRGCIRWLMDMVISKSKVDTVPKGDSIPKGLKNYGLFLSGNIPYARLEIS